MKNLTPDDRDRYYRSREFGKAARRQMQEILDRVEARQRERAAWRERSWFRRLLPW